MAFDYPGANRRPDLITQIVRSGNPRYREVVIDTSNSQSNNGGK